MRHKMEVFVKESRAIGSSTPKTVVVAAATLGEIYGRCAMTPKIFELGGCSCQDGEISKAPARYKYRYGPLEEYTSFAASTRHP